jgi:hypothetical protein
MKRKINLNPMSELTKEFFEEKLKDLATKDDVAVLEQKISELPSKQDYDALKSVVDDIDEKVTRLDKRSDEDIRAAYKDIESLKNRVTVIEQK